MTSEYFCWLDGYAMENGRRIVCWAEGWRCITLLNKFVMSVSHLIGDVKFSVECENLAQVRCQGRRKIL